MGTRKVTVSTDRKKTCTDTGEYICSSVGHRRCGRGVQVATSKSADEEARADQGAFWISEGDQRRRFRKEDAATVERRKAGNSGKEEK